MTATIELPISMRGESQEVIERFFSLVRNGMKPMLATIVASRHCPELGTDTARMASLPPLEETCGKEYARLRKEEARKAGISISDNSRYNPTMADGRRGADPKAWTHAGDGPSTMKRRLQDMGGGCEQLGVENDLSRTAETMEKKKAAFIKRQKRKYERKAVVLEKIIKSR